MNNTSMDIISMKREFKQRSRLAMFNICSGNTINEVLNEQSSPDINFTMKSRDAKHFKTTSVTPMVGSIEQFDKNSQATLADGS